MFLIYDILSSLVIATAILPWHLLLIVLGSFTWRNLQQRLGTNHVPSRLKKQRILIHAVSVGEVAAAEPLIRELLEVIPDIELVLTTGNNDGMNSAQRLQRTYPAILHIQFLPWDGTMMLSSWIHHLNPDMVLILETELWPIFIRTCHQLNIPVCIVNGRIYPRDVYRYLLVCRFLQRVFKYVDWIGVQSEREKERFLAIGAEEHQIHVMGNLKFDASLPRYSESGMVDKLLNGVQELIVGGSTHRPEEKWLLESFLQLRTHFSGLRLVLAPRHIRRAGSVDRLARRLDIRSVQLSMLERAQHNWDVLILDQTGWLPAAYGHAAVVVIGGSFVHEGGHNILEAAAQGRPIVIGPHTQHFESIVESFQRSRAIVRLNSRLELTPTLRSLLSDPSKRSELGTRAKTVLETQQGIARQYVRVLEKRLKTGDSMSSDDRFSIAVEKSNAPR